MANFAFFRDLIKLKCWLLYFLGTQVFVLFLWIIFRILFRKLFSNACVYWFCILLMLISLLSNNQGCPILFVITRLCLYWHPNLRSVSFIYYDRVTFNVPHASQKNWISFLTWVKTLTKKGNVLKNMVLKFLV